METTAAGSQLLMLFWSQVSERLITTVWAKIYSYWTIFTEVMQNITEVQFFLSTVYILRLAFTVLVASRHVSYWNLCIMFKQSKIPFIHSILYASKPCVRWLLLLSLFYSCDVVKCIIMLWMFICEKGCTGLWSGLRLTCRAMSLTCLNQCFKGLQIVKVFYIIMVHWREHLL